MASRESACDVSEAPTRCPSYPPSMRPLSLHHLTVPDISAVELVGIAADVGCAHVCLFTQDPNAGIPFPVVVEHEVAELEKVMAGCGVTAYGVTSFALAPQMHVAACAPALERGARLGAVRANVRVADPDQGRAAANFNALSTLAAGHGMEATIEFAGFAATDALPQALRIVRAVGRGKITLDALHVVRTATPMEALRALEPDVIGYLQLCDGPLAATADDYRHEGAWDRLAPGEGEFPLRELLALVPADFPASLEVPCERWRLEGMPATERARRVVEATRRLTRDEERAHG
jgi:sugar phosphate isomerase/epimerase